MCKSLRGRASFWARISGPKMEPRFYKKYAGLRNNSGPWQKTSPRRSSKPGPEGTPKRAPQRGLDASLQDGDGDGNERAQLGATGSDLESSHRHGPPRFMQIAAMALGRATRTFLDWLRDVPSQA